MTLEVNFIITETDDIKGGVDLKLITAGGGSNYSEQQVQKITLDLVALPEPKSTEAHPAASNPTQTTTPSSPPEPPRPTYGGGGGRILK
jgi:hypothetical protein